MKLSKDYLKQIIKEEISKIIEAGEESSEDYRLKFERDANLYMSQYKVKEPKIDKSGRTVEFNFMIPFKYRLIKPILSRTTKFKYNDATNTSNTEHEHYTEKDLADILEDQAPVDRINIELTTVARYLLNK
jgi:hypothetical protein